MVPWKKLGSLKLRRRLRKGEQLRKTADRLDEGPARRLAIVNDHFIGGRATRSTSQASAQVRRTRKRQFRNVRTNITSRVNVVYPDAANRENMLTTSRGRD